ncbi:unnamed protein product [Symbiodinium natans]|uniref:Uncharacterized protein n=1 Tax=Symbiodinium natans TaxID=878477 RepID=A0A812HM04_9DINO|nr:unnamed protein product [Symbiodinium natans]
MLRWAVLLSFFTVAAAEGCEGKLEKDHQRSGSCEDDIDASQLLQHALAEKETSWEDFRLASKGSPEFSIHLAFMGFRAAKYMLHEEAEEVHEAAQHAGNQLRRMVDTAPPEQVREVFRQALTPMEDFLNDVQKQLDRGVPLVDHSLSSYDLYRARKAYLSSVQDAHSVLAKLWSICTKLDHRHIENDLRECTQASKAFEEAYPKAKLDFLSALEEEFEKRVEHRQNLRKFANIIVAEMMAIARHMSQEVSKVLTDTTEGLAKLAGLLPEGANATEAAAS